jgi:hypothetical protein
VFSQTWPGSALGATALCAGAAGTEAFVEAPPDGAIADGDGTGSALGSAEGTGFALNHVLTPLWSAQAPFFTAAVVKVPSLHCPVAPAGACARTVRPDPKKSAVTIPKKCFFKGNLPNDAQS